MNKEHKHLEEADLLELIRLVAAYQNEQAMKQFYHENYHAYENYEGPRVGMNKTLERIEGERDSMKILYHLKPLVWMMKDNQSMIQWKCELQDAEGKHWYAEEVNIATWENRKIIKEQYVYSQPIAINKPSAEAILWKNPNLT